MLFRSSGSHERYKTPERLQWEREWDCIKKMKEWLIENALANEEDLNQIEVEAKEQVRKEKQQAWENFLEPISKQVNRVVSLLNSLSPINGAENLITGYVHELSTNREPSRRDVMRALYKGISLAQPGAAKSSAQQYYQELTAENNIAFHSSQQVEHIEIGRAHV